LSVPPRPVPRVLPLANVPSRLVNADGTLVNLYLCPVPRILPLENRSMPLLCVSSRPVPVPLCLARR
jgi:hypothetical protein